MQKSITPVSKKQRLWTIRRWIRNQIYWKKNEIRAVFWHLSTYCRKPKVYRICHWYDYGTTQSGFVWGRGNPENILAYLKFLVEDHFADDAEIDHTTVAQLLAKHYGYTVLQSDLLDTGEPVDRYSIREDRCGNTLHWWLAKLLYYRRDLLEDLKKCVRFGFDEVLDQPEMRR